jgi:tetratricopeptide (TPR) repeat protein
MDGKNMDMFLPGWILPEDDKSIIQLINEFQEENRFIKTHYSEIKKKSNSSVGLKEKHEKVKWEFEKLLLSRFEDSTLKSQACIALKTNDYDLLATLLLKAASENVKKSAEIFFGLAKVEFLRLNNLKSVQYYEVAAKLEPNNILYLNHAGTENKILKRFDRALYYFDKVLVSCRNNVDSENSQVAMAWENLGDTFFEKREYDKAIECYENALVINKKEFGEKHPSITSDYIALGEILQKKGFYNDALSYIKNALKIDIKSHGKYHPDVMRDYNNLGAVYDAKGDFDKAIKNYNQALIVNKQLYGEENIQVGFTLNNLGCAFNSKGKSDLAIEYHLKALSLIQKHFTESNEYIAGTFNNLGSAHESQGEFDKAIDYYLKALLTDKEIYGDLLNSDIALHQNNLGGVLLKVKAFDSAIECFMISIKIITNLSGNDDPFLNSSYNKLATAFLFKGDYDKAIETYEKILKIEKYKYGVWHPSIPTYYNKLGLVCQLKQDLEKAIEYYSMSYVTMKKIAGENSTYAIEIKNNLDLAIFEKSKSTL